MLVLINFFQGELCGGVGRDSRGLSAIHPSSIDLSNLYSSQSTENSSSRLFQPLHCLLLIYSFIIVYWSHLRLRALYILMISVISCDFTD